MPKALPRYVAAIFAALEEGSGGGTNCMSGQSPIASRMEAMMPLQVHSRIIALFTNSPLNVNVSMAGMASRLFAEHGLYQQCIKPARRQQPGKQDQQFRIQSRRIARPGCASTHDNIDGDPRHIFRLRCVF